MGDFPTGDGRLAYNKTIRQNGLIFVYRLAENISEHINKKWCYCPYLEGGFMTGS